MSDLISRTEARKTYKHLCVAVACAECTFFNREEDECKLARWLIDLPSAEPELMPREELPFE